MVVVTFCNEGTPQVSDSFLPWTLILTYSERHYGSCYLPLRYDFVLFHRIFYFLQKRRVFDPSFFRRGNDRTSYTFLRIFHPCRTRFTYLTHQTTLTSSPTLPTPHFIWVCRTSFIYRIWIPNPNEKGGNLKSYVHYLLTIDLVIDRLQKWR